jgi:hypothetical protein
VYLIRNPMAARAQPSLQTRRSLLSRIKDWDDRDGWQQFYDTYSNLIFGAALSAGLNHGEAEEVLQETVLTVAKKLRADTGRSPPSNMTPQKDRSRASCFTPHAGKSLTSFVNAALWFANLRGATHAPTAPPLRPESRTRTMILRLSSIGITDKRFKRQPWRE